jgi:hypothetical protein
MTSWAFLKPENQQHLTATFDLERVVFTSTRFGL